MSQRIITEKDRRAAVEYALKLGNVGDADGLVAQARIIADFLTGTDDSKILEAARVFANVVKDDGLPKPFHIHEWQAAREANLQKASEERLSPPMRRPLSWQLEVPASDPRLSQGEKDNR